MCLLCHGQGTTNSNPYPPTWNGGANGSTANPGIYTIAPGSPADHTNYSVDQCTQAGCHAAAGSSTTPPTSSTTPPTSSTTPPTSSTTPPTTTTKPSVSYVDINEGAFQPGSLAVKVGTTVTFTNNRETTTDLTCDALEIDVTLTRNGGTTSYTFNSAGTFKFLTDEGIAIVITVQS
jgi:plastocyanin